jgi:hypothetical protein
MAAEYQIRKVEIRAARKPYGCQCGQEGCQERIVIGEEYANFKIVEKLQGSFKNKEKKVSQKCDWFNKWREFLQL